MPKLYLERAFKGLLDGDKAWRQPRCSGPLRTLSSHTPATATCWLECSEVGQLSLLGPPSLCPPCLSTLRRDSYLASRLWPEWPQVHSPREDRAWNRARANAAGELITPQPHLHPSPLPPTQATSQGPREGTAVPTTPGTSAQLQGIISLCGGQPSPPQVPDTLLGRK